MRSGGVPHQIIKRNEFYIQPQSRQLMPISYRLRSFPFIADPVERAMQWLGISKSFEYCWPYPLAAGIIICGAV